MDLLTDVRGNECCSGAAFSQKSQPPTELSGACQRGPGPLPSHLHAPTEEATTDSPRFLYAATCTHCRIATAHLMMLGKGEGGVLGPRDHGVDGLGMPGHQPRRAPGPHPHRPPRPPRTHLMHIVSTWSGWVQNSRMRMYPFIASLTAPWEAQQSARARCAALTASLD